MEQALVSLMNALMMDSEPQGPGRGQAPSSGKGLFSGLLSQAVSRSAKGGSGEAEASARTGGAIDLSELLSALIGNDMAEFVKALQSVSAPQEATGAESPAEAKGSTTPGGGSTLPEGTNGSLQTAAQTAQGKAAGGSDAKGKEIEALVMTLLSLIGQENTQQDGGARAACTTGREAKAGEGQAEEATGGTPKGAQSKNDASVLETLALLLFAGLESTAAGQGTDGKAAPQGQGQRQGPEGTPGASAGPVGQKAALEAMGPAAMLQHAAEASLPETDPAAAQAAGQGSGSPAQAAEAPAKMVSFDASLVPASQPSTGDAKNSLTVTIKASPALLERAAATGQSVPAGQSVSGQARETEGVSNALLTIVREVTPPGGARDGGASSQDGAGREKQDGRDVYPLAPDKAAPLPDVSGQDQKAAAEVHGAAAVERFDRVMDQLSGKAGPHDLTVRVALGNEQSLVLGLKDLGPTITVDVRSSDQGMIGLLQSQRDSIVRHLQGKDINTQIVIDPNASQTPDRRDRREAGQGFTRKRRQDEGFGTFLETFA